MRIATAAPRPSSTSDWYGDAASTTRPEARADEEPARPLGSQASIQGIRLATASLTHAFREGIMPGPEFTTRLSFDAPEIDHVLRVVGLRGREPPGFLFQDEIGTAEMQMFAGNVPVDFPAIGFARHLAVTTDVQGEVPVLRGTEPGE